MHQGDLQHMCLNTRTNQQRRLLAISQNIIDTQCVTLQIDIQRRDTERKRGREGGDERGREGRRDGEGGREGGGGR